MTKEKKHNLQNLIKQLDKTKSYIESCIRNLQRELNESKSSEEHNNGEDVLKSPCRDSGVIPVQVRRSDDTSICKNCGKHKGEHFQINSHSYDLACDINVFSKFELKEELKEVLK